VGLLALLLATSAAGFSVDDVQALYSAVWNYYSGASTHCSYDSFFSDQFLQAAADDIQRAIAAGQPSDFCATESDAVQGYDCVYETISKLANSFYYIGSAFAQSNAISDAKQYALVEAFYSSGCAIRPPCTVSFDEWYNQVSQADLSAFLQDLTTARTITSPSAPT
jgi:hypothetical protein